MTYSVSPPRAPQNLTMNRESRSSSQSTDIGESTNPKVFKMFSRNYSGRDPHTWWYVAFPPTSTQPLRSRKPFFDMLTIIDRALKLGHLVIIVHNLQAAYVTLPSLEGVEDPPANLLSLFHAWKLVFEDIEDAIQKLRDLAT